MKAPVGGGILVLFPGCMAPGGIQASGRIAWQAISAGRAAGTATLFCYGDTGPPEGAGSENALHTVSKLRAARAAVMMRRRFRLVVVWHMDLLKLVPLLRLRGARVVLMLQGVEAWRRRSWPERLLLRRVDQFVSISDYTWQRFREANQEYADAPHCTVPLGIGSPWIGQAPEPGATPAALMVSRLARGEDYKGHREMIDAWPLVLRTWPTAQLRIAGDGDLRPELERLVAARDLGSTVQFLGFVSEEDKQDLIRQSRCMAVPSRGEGFGLVYLEAMRLGRPCLVSTLDAGREVVAPPLAGVAVHPDDRDGLADAVCRLLANGGEWQRWSLRARQRYEQHFTAKHYQQRLMAALESPDVGRAAVA